MIPESETPAESQACVEQAPDAPNVQEQPADDTGREPQESLDPDQEGPAT